MSASTPRNDPQMPSSPNRKYFHISHTYTPLQVHGVCRANKELVYHPIQVVNSLDYILDYLIHSYHLLNLQN